VLRVGGMELPCAGADREARVYLRPEDVLARPIADGDAHVFEATIEAIEFLGAHCHVQVRAAGFAAQPLSVNLSLNFLVERKLGVGSRLPLRLMADRVRVF